MAERVSVRLTRRRPEQGALPVLRPGETPTQLAAARRPTPSIALGQAFDRPGTLR